MNRFSLIAFFAAAAFAQDPAGLMNDPSIRAAFDAVKRNEPSVIQQQIKLCEIPAPPFHEEVRGRELARLFESLGLHDVRMTAPGT